MSSARFDSHTGGVEEGGDDILSTESFAVLKAGFKLNVLKALNEPNERWRICTVVDSDLQRIRVRYDAFDVVHDEWLAKTSPRIEHTSTGSLKTFHHYENGECYEGELKDGRPHGQGVCYYENGARYEGEFKDGKRSGQGSYLQRNGERFEAEWGNGKRTGLGTLCYPDGARYRGSFNKEGQRHGHGEFWTTHGNRYEGQWDNNKAHGYGSYHYAEGGKYEGQWKAGKRHGKGAIFDSSGCTKTVYNEADEGYHPSTAQVAAERKLPSLRGKWQPDFTSQCCTRCDAKFSIFRYKHHCRNCGGLICHACSRFADLGSETRIVTRVCADIAACNVELSCEGAAGADNVMAACGPLLNKQSIQIGEDQEQKDEITQGQKQEGAAGMTEISNGCSSLSSPPPVASGGGSGDGSGSTGSSGAAASGSDPALPFSVSNTVVSTGESAAIDRTEQCGAELAGQSSSGYLVGVTQMSTRMLREQLEGKKHIGSRAKSVHYFLSHRAQLKDQGGGLGSLLSGCTQVCGSGGSLVVSV
jgi:hypothetical protein